jgi:hypothetical protein
MPILGKGTKFKVGDGGSPEVFTLIPAIRSITGPGNTAEVLDSTTMDTPQGFRDKFQGLKDHGAFSFEMLWDPAHALHQQLYNDFKAGTERNYQVEFADPGTTTFSFRGFVNSCPVTAAFDQLLSMQVEITIKGDPEPILA